MERQRAMRQQVNDVGGENERLRKQIGRLRGRVELLKTVLSEHRLQRCNLMTLSAGAVDTNNVTLDLDKLLTTDSYL